MNYRIMVKGALALSLSLMVGSAWAVTETPRDVQAYGATFEPTESATAGQLNDFNYGLGTNITAFTKTEGGETYGWLMDGVEEDESKIVAGGPTGSTQTLQLNTDANTLSNKFSSTVAGAVNTAIGNNGTAFFETEVKFVASDTLDAGIPGGQDATKFAIYAYVNENVEPNTTNLVVFHAYYDPEDETLAGNSGIGYTNEVFTSVTIDTEVFTKLRIEMKQIDAGGTPLNLFSISINGGQPLTSASAYEGNTWFITTENIGDDNFRPVSSLNFKGTGEIDNISVGTIAIDTTYAVDWTDSDGVAVTSAGNALADDATNFVAGAEIVFTATGENVITNITVDGAAQSITNDTVYSYFVGSADAKVTVLAGIQVTPLDDTWTIEGFNPAPAVWPLPAAVSPDNKTLFYSNVVDNIDDANASIGRTIKAAWIGAKIIAPEAVTDETIANWKFDMAGAPGNSFASSNDGKENGHYVMNLWVPLTAAKIRTAVANRSDITYALDFYLNGGTTTQTLAMVISPKDIKLTNTDNVSDVEEIEVINWEIQSAQQEKPAWAADADDTAFWTWAANHADGVDLTTDYTAQYLMNVDTDKTPVLKIDSIEVTDEGSKIVVSANDGTNAIDLDAINGVLNVSVGDTLTNLTSKDPDANATFANNKATIIIKTADGKFAKATVDFTAAETKLSQVSQ